MIELSALASGLEKATELSSGILTDGRFPHPEDLAKILDVIKNENPIPKDSPLFERRPPEGRDIPFSAYICTEGNPALVTLVPGGEGDLRRFFSEGGAFEKVISVPFEGAKVFVTGPELYNLPTHAICAIKEKVGQAGGRLEGGLPKGTEGDNAREKLSPEGRKQFGEIRAKVAELKEPAKLVEQIVKTLETDPKAERLRECCAKLDEARGKFFRAAEGVSNPELAAANMNPLSEKEGETLRTNMGFSKGKWREMEGTEDRARLEAAWRSGQSSETRIALVQANRELGIQRGNLMENVVKDYLKEHAAGIKIDDATFDNDGNRTYTDLKITMKTGETVTVEVKTGKPGYLGQQFGEGCKIDRNLEGMSGVKEVWVSSDFDKLVNAEAIRVRLGEERVQVVKILPDSATIDRCIRKALEAGQS